VAATVKVCPSVAARLTSIVIQKYTVVFLVFMIKPLNVCELVPGTFVTAICVGDVKALVVVVHSLKVLMSADTHVPLAVKLTHVTLFALPFPVMEKLWIGAFTEPAQTLAAPTGFAENVRLEAFASKFHPTNKRASGKKGFNHRVFHRLPSICAF
jgi:hypothetical protein